MSKPSRWIAHGADPLPQLLTDHPEFRESASLLVASQGAAMAHWPAIESYAGDVSIVLRRPGYGDRSEWHHELEIFRQLVSTATRDLRLFAMNQAAAGYLAAETQLPVSVMPPLSCRYAGSRILTLSRPSGQLSLTSAGASPLPAGRYNLARLRRVALLHADGDDSDLSDIAAYANGERFDDGEARPVAPVVIVVVPNGIGLGHVTRMLAIARHLRKDRGARVVFWSFSRSAGIISRFGFETFLRQTAQHLGANTDDWLDWETEEFAATLSHLQPELVVQDSSALQRFVVDALSRPGTGAARLALVRRGMWQKHILGTEALASEDLADLVCEPGDLAAEADRGVTRGRFEKTNTFAKMARSAPVTLTRNEDLLDRRRARRALGLGRGRHCLISLGGDAFGDWSLLVRHIVGAAATARVRLVWARSPLAPADPDLSDDPAIISRSIYPLAPYLQAFDGVVSSAGYNSFHELMQFYDGPVLLVPKQHESLDDQPARAQFAASQGWAAHLPDGESEHETVKSFMADIRAGKKTSERPQWRDGAAEIAGELAHLMEPGVRLE